MLKLEGKSLVVKNYEEGDLRKFLNKYEYSHDYPEKLILEGRNPGIEDFFEYDYETEDIFSKIVEFEIHETGNESEFKIIDGILYSKSGWRLIKCPRSKTGTIVVEPWTGCIAAYAFHRCENIDTVILANETECIKESAFEQCHNLKSIKNTEKLREIRRDAFLECERLEDFFFGPELQSIGYSAFSRTGLKEINLPDTKDYLYIEERAFEECNNVKSVRLPKNIHLFNSALHGIPCIEKPKYYKDVVSACVKRTFLRDFEEPEFAYTILKVDGYTPVILPQYVYDDVWNIEQRVSNFFEVENIEPEDIDLLESVCTYAKGFTSLLMELEYYRYYKTKTSKDVLNKNVEKIADFFAERTEEEFLDITKINAWDRRSLKVFLDTANKKQYDVAASYIRKKIKKLPLLIFEKKLKKIGR